MWVWIGDLIDRQMHWLGTSHIQTRSRWNEWAVTGEGGKERRRNVWYAIARQNQQILFRNQSSTVHMCTVLVCFQPLRVNGQCPVERRLIDRRPANRVSSFVHVYNTCTDYQFCFYYCRVYDSFSNICNNTRLLLYPICLRLTIRFIVEVKLLIDWINVSFPYYLNEKKRNLCQSSSHTPPHKIPSVIFFFSFLCC